MKNWLKLGLLALTAVVVTQLLVQRSAPVLGEGTPAPPLAFPDLEGRAVDLAALRGKVVAVNFWATWCGPCRAEIPELAEVWQAYRGRCFELLGVAEESGVEDVRRMAQQIPYPVLLDVRAEALDPWGVRGYPVTYVVDPEGRIRSVLRGAISRDELVQAITPHLPGSCTAG